MSSRAPRAGLSQMRWSTCVVDLEQSKLALSACPVAKTISKNVMPVNAEKPAEPAIAKRPQHVRCAPHLAAPSPMMENGAQNAG
jgi:hypothetical protein